MITTECKHFSLSIYSSG